MRAPHDVVFLLDVDHTLLDNDAMIEDVRRRTGILIRVGVLALQRMRAP